MTKHFIFATTLSAFAFTGLVSAQSGISGSGTLGVTAQIQGSILVTFTSDVAGLAVTGTGSSAGALPFASEQMYGGTPATGVTRALTSNTSYTLSTPVDIQVDVANTTTSTYLLAASLTTADTHHSFTFNSVVLSASPQTVDATGTYGQANSYTFILTVPAASVANTISNTINFTATSN